MNSFETVEAIRGHTNRTNHRAELTGVIEGLKSIPYGREVKIATDVPSAITVGFGNNPHLKHMDLIHRDRDLLRGLKPTFAHVSGHTGRQETKFADTRTSGTAHGRIGCTVVHEQARRHPCLSRP
jgi:ribonuclease HI